MKILVWFIYDYVKYVVVMMVSSKYSDACQDMGLTDVENYSKGLIQ